MKTRLIRTAGALSMAAFLALSVAACNATSATTGTSTASVPAAAAPAAGTSATTATAAKTAGSSATTLNTSGIFTDRDMKQTADTSGATMVKLEDGKNVTLSKEGVYVLTGTARNVTVTVAADDKSMVQLVLDGVSITNDTAPAIDVRTADKVFVTTTGSGNSLKVTSTFATDGSTHPDAVIFSKSDLTLNGTGSLEISSAKGNGVSSKDELTITGGTYVITSAEDALEANDGIYISDGTFTINSGKDALHSENTDDTSLGHVLIQGGTLNISAADDGIHGNSVVQVDGGTIDIKTSSEGIEGSNIVLNDGKITVYAKDDGINASKKNSNTPTIVVNGGTIAVSIAAGDTDGFDANGDITINGGTISVQGNSAFDADGSATLKGGNVTVNGQKITEIVQTGPGGGGFGGGRHK